MKSLFICLWSITTITQHTSGMLRVHMKYAMRIPCEGPGAVYLSQDAGHKLSPRSGRQLEYVMDLVCVEQQGQAIG